MNDVRLIDADEIRKKAVPHTRGEHGYNANIRKWAVLVGDIDDAPTINAVPVVRKPVAGYEGYYEVDQFGRVFSLDRVVTVVDGDRTYEKPLSGKQMKQHMHSGGYKVVALTKDGKSKNIFVHRIVAEAFLPNPDNLPMVNHKDEDKTNNFLENLEWCTAAYNRTYGKAVERHAKKLRGCESEKRKAVIQRGLDGSFVDWHESVTKAAEKMNGSTTAISKACKGERKTAYGYLWEYDFCSYGERKDGGKFITKLLNTQVNMTRNSLIDSIDHGHDDLIANEIKMYREALFARNDFSDWVDDQEDGDG